MKFFSFINSTALISTLPALGLVSMPAYAQYNVGAGENYVVTSGTIVPGVDVDGVAGGSVTNSGTIIDDATYGVVLFNNPADLTGGIINNTGGLISGGLAGILSAPSADISGGIINNDGATIYGGANAIQVNGYGSISGNIDNTGDIIGGVKGIYTAGFAFVAGDINNTGSIVGGTDGIHLLGSSVTGDINNNVGGLISGGEKGIWIQSISMSGGINNSGTIRGYDDGSPATSGAIYIQSGRVVGGITNSGIIDGQGNIAINMVALNGLNAMTFNGGRVIGDVVDDNPVAGRSTIDITGDFATEGDITVSDLTVAAGQGFSISPDNVVTLDDMSVSAGTFYFGVNVENQSSRLVVTNGNVDLTGASVAAGQIKGSLAVGNTILLADGNAVVTAGPGGTPLSIVDASALWNFQLVDGTYAGIGGDNTELYALVSQGASGSIADIGSAVNNQSAGAVLDTLNNTNNAELSSIINNINNADSVEDVQDIIEAVTVSPNRAAVLTSQTLSSKTRSMVAQRLSSQGTGISTGDEPIVSPFKGLKFWGQSYNAIAKQGTRNNVSGFDASTAGFAIGVDTENLHDDMVVGVSVGYSNTDVDSKDANNSSVDIGSAQITIYGDYDLDEDITVKGSAGYVRGTNKTKRYNVGGVGGLTAYGDYATNYYFAEAEIGRTYGFKSLSLVPALGVFYGHHSSDDYTEAGAGGANLSVESKDINIVELGAKVDASWAYEIDSEFMLEPRLHLGYRYDVIGDNVVTTSRFTGDGTSFTSTGADPARGTLNLGTGFSISSEKHWSFDAGYDFEYKQDYHAHSVFLKMRYKF